MNNMVNHPKHYNHGKLEVIDIIKDQLDGAPIKPFEGGLFFNVVKYILRAPYKENKVEDLNKAKWYLERWINLLEKSNDNKRVTLGLSAAEVFDGSDKMIDKYNIEMVEGDYADDYSMPEAGPAPYVRYFMPKVDGAEEISAGDIIATGIDGEHSVVKKL